MKIKTMLFAVIALTVFAAACSFTTAKLGELKFAKNDKAGAATTTFDVGDKIFMVVDTTGAMGTHKIKFAAKIEGPNAKPGQDTLNQEVAVVGNGSANMSFTAGMPGTVKVDVTMIDESGKEIDKKSGSFTIKGPPAPTPDTSAKPDADSDKDADEEKK